MDTTCDVCGCIYDRGVYIDEPRECPVCKLRNDIPAMLDDLYDRIKERGTWDKYY